ncbi:MAG: hypothetical protein GX625_15460 [Clostridiaceae bacterium]|nr:hypothetical protein [Clostridiaceae bacterium]
MSIKQSLGILAVAMLVALALAGGCTGTSDNDAQTQGTQTEGTGAPQVNESFQPPGNRTGPEQGGRPQMDLASAAAALGVTEEELRAALGEQGQGQNNFAAAAATLGVTEEELMEALGVPEGMGEGGMPGGMENGTPPEPR